MKRQAEQLVRYLQDKQWRIRCVESCTAGGLTAALGSIAGVSEVLDRSWVTYSNQAKHEEVGVPWALLEAHGAVSQEVALAMSEGAVSGCEHDTLALAITGIAGPGGGSADKPVGTVWIALKQPHQPAFARCFHFQGTRAQVQHAAILQALTMPLS